MLRNRTIKANIIYVYYKCRSYTQRGEKLCNHKHGVREEAITQAVLEAINMQIKSLIDIKQLIIQISDLKTVKTEVVNFDKLMSAKKKLISKNRNLKVMCYEDWKDGLIDKQDYLHMNNKYASKINTLSNEIIELMSEKKTYLDMQNNRLDWVDEIIKNGIIIKLTREVMVSLIKIIYVHQGNILEIVFNFKKEYQQLENYAVSHKHLLEDKTNVQQ